MDDLIKANLEAEEPNEFAKRILEETKQLIAMSRRTMRNFHNRWERSDRIYRGEIVPDKADKAAAERKEPVKMTVPMSYSQIQTFVSFCFSLYTQRERFFELLGMSEEDHKPAKIGEAFLARDLNYNQFEVKLYQFLLDIGKYGLGILKTSWTRETQKTRQETAAPPGDFLGFQLQGETQISEGMTTKYLGNKISNVTPFRFFPDTRLPVCRFQEGEFCASEDEFSYTALKQMEKDGQITGTKWLKPATAKMLQDRDWNFMPRDVTDGPNMTPAQSKGVFILTEVQRVLIPNEYEIETGKTLGKEDYPVKYLIVYANDMRLVRCEPMNYLHDQFTYQIAEFNPDKNNLVNQGLHDSIDALQDVISWFINSRITSVRKVIQNYLVVDPEGIEMSDLNERKPVIRLKPTAARQGVDKFVKQLDLQDVTTNHLKDADFLKQLIYETTGITENLLGQFYGGRRSATEARNVNSSAAARLKMLASIIFISALEPMGRQMLSNLRDGLDEETMVRLVGIEPTIESGAGFVKADKSDLAGNYDFEIFDGTIPSEKQMTAQVLQEVLMGVFSNPELAIALQIDPKALLLEMMELRGVRNPERFTLKPAIPANVDNVVQPQFQDQNAGQEAGGGAGFSDVIGGSASGSQGAL